MEPLEIQLSDEELCGNQHDTDRARIGEERIEGGCQRVEGCRIQRPRAFQEGDVIGVTLARYCTLQFRFPG
jgi:hypothetical protein